MNKTILTTGEIAQHCQVTLRAVLKWVANGKLKAYRTPGKHSRVNIEDFISFLQEYGMPIPQKFDHLVNHKKKILIVEDDKSIVKVIENILSKEDYELKIAYDGFSAGLIFSEFKPDLVTLDIHMPMVDGYEVCQKIRNHSQNDSVRILVITDIEDKRVENKMRELGANDFMNKPISSEKLFIKVQELLVRELV